MERNQNKFVIKQVETLTINEYRNSNGPSCGHNNQLIFTFKDEQY
jgi:hypothetical protein